MPAVALVDAPDHPSGVFGEDKHWDYHDSGRWFRIAGLILMALAMRRFLRIDRFARSWPYCWKPSVILTLCLLAPLPFVHDVPGLLDTDSEGRVQHRELPVAISAMRHMGDREIGVAAPIEQVVAALKQTAENHGYLTPGTFNWVLSTAPEDETVGAVRLIKFRKLQSLAHGLRRAWRGPPRPEPVSQFDVRCVGSANPPETWVTVTPGAYGPGWPEPTDWPKLISELESVVKVCERRSPDRGVGSGQVSGPDATELMQAATQGQVRRIRQLLAGLARDLGVEVARSASERDLRQALARLVAESPQARARVLRMIADMDVKVSSSATPEQLIATLESIVAHLGE